MLVLGQVLAIKLKARPHAHPQGRFRLKRRSDASIMRKGCCLKFFWDSFLPLPTGRHLAHEDPGLDLSAAAAAAAAVMLMQAMHVKHAIRH